MLSPLISSVLLATAALQHSAPLTEKQQHHATVAFVRHGQSEWNACNRFTGWTDIDLTTVGREEAATGGVALKESGLSFDRAFTSSLRRAQETLTIVLHHAGMHDMPTMSTWRLNEVCAARAF